MMCGYTGLAIAALCTLGGCAQIRNVDLGSDRTNDAATADAGPDADDGATLDAHRGDDDDLLEP